MVFIRRGLIGGSEYISAYFLWSDGVIKNIIFCQQALMIFKVQFGKQIHLINSSDKLKLDQFLVILPTVFKSLPSRYTLSYLDQDGDEITLKDQSDYEVLLSSGLKTARITLRECSEEFMEVTNQVHIEQPALQIIEAEISEIKIVEEQHLPGPHSFVEDFTSKQPKMEHQCEPSVSQIDGSMIEEKLRKMLPSIISKIKNQLTEEMMERSKQSQKMDESKQKQKQNKKGEMKETVGINAASEVVIHNRVNCDGCGQKGIIGIRYKCAVCPDFDFCQRCEALIDHPHPFLKIKNLKQTPRKIITVLDDEEEDSLEINGQRTDISPFLNCFANQGFNIVEGFLNNNRMFNANASKQEEKTEKEAPVTEKKEEPKVEKMVEEPAAVKEEKIEKKVNVQKMDEEKVNNYVENAHYIAEVLGLPTAKCIRYAKIFPTFSKEELLNECISNHKFFTEMQ